MRGHGTGWQFPSGVTTALLLALIACSGSGGTAPITAPATREEISPTPNIKHTVEAAIEATAEAASTSVTATPAPNIEATITAAIQATAEAASTATPASVPTPRGKALELLSSRWGPEPEPKGYGFRAVVGKIRNNSQKTYVLVTVTINLYDGNDNLVGNAIDVINNLAPGAVWSFKAFVDNDNVRRFEVAISGF